MHPEAEPMSILTDLQMNSAPKAITPENLANNQKNLRRIEAVEVEKQQVRHQTSFRHSNIEFKNLQFKEKVDTVNRIKSKLESIELSSIKSREDRIKKGKMKFAELEPHEKKMRIDYLWARLRL